MSRGTSICYQFNLEYLAQVVWSNEVMGSDSSFLITYWVPIHNLFIIF